jgi:DNA-binding transcriptional regulator GbsR (MarR family)
MARDRAPITRRQLVTSQDQFVQAWGQLGPAWGISRTMAEAHALLYISGRALNTDEVMERLRISRGNASMTLRSLVEWGIVSRVHKPGDRKEYYTAEQDVWTLARQIIRERLRREILPALASLHETRDLTRAPGQERSGRRDVAGKITPRTAVGDSDDSHAPPTADELDQHNQRLDALLELVTMIDKLAERFVGSEGKGLKMAATLLSKIV